MYTVYTVWVLHCGIALHVFPTLGMIRSRLKGRSSKTLVGLGRMLHRLSSARVGEAIGTVSVNRLQLQQALRAFHISLTPEVSALLLCDWVWKELYVFLFLTASISSFSLFCSFSLSLQDFGQLWALLMEREMCCHDDRQEKGLWVDRSIAGLVGDIGEDRTAIIRKVRIRRPVNSTRN